MRPEGTPARAARAVLAQLAQATPRAGGHELQGTGTARRRRGRLTPRQLRRDPGVAPRPQPEAEEVGRYQRQLPASDLAGDRGHAHQPDEDGQRQPYPRGTEGGEAVGAVGEGRDCRQGHDLGEGEPEQDAVLGLHVGGYFVCLHVDAYPPSVPMRDVVGTGTSSMSTTGSTTAPMTSSTMP